MQKETRFTQRWGTWGLNLGFLVDMTGVHAWGSLEDWLRESKSIPHVT
jgi:hypothetical protein